MPDMPTIERPAADLTIITVWPIELAFSYQTVIGFRPRSHDPWIVSENLWGSTTGKHLNLIPHNKADRLDRGLFEATLLGHLALVTAGAYRDYAEEDA